MVKYSKKKGDTNREKDIPFTYDIFNFSISCSLFIDEICIVDQRAGYQSYCHVFRVIWNTDFIFSFMVLFYRSHL
jgi:hypothetical protein